MIDAAKQKFDEMSKLYGKQVDEELSANVGKVTRGLWLSHCEGLIITLFTSTEPNKATIRSKALGIKKVSLGRKGCKWEEVHAVLKDKVTQAVKMQG